MPGGLPDVSQKFTAESSGYSAAIAAMIRDNQALIKSIGEAQRKIAELKAEIGGLGDKRIKVEVTGIDRAISDIGRLKAALDGLGDRSVTVRVVNEGSTGTGGAAGAAAASDVARQARDMRDAASSMADAAEKMRRATRDPGGGAAARGAASSAADAISAEVARRASSDLVPSLSRLLSDAFRRAYSDAGVHHALGPGGGLEHAGGGPGWTWTASVIPDMMRAIGSGGGPWGPWGHGGGVGWPSGGWTGGGFGAPGWANGGGSSAGGSGGGGYAAGGLWAAAGGGRDAGGFMTAAQYADKIVPWLKRWAPIAHYAIMGVNEALATILPATAAAGAATLVGWQGVEQMIPRVKAINATAESLGPAYGITSGQYLGTGSAIQRYQNLATGGVYELGGAGINLMRMGAGTFGQTGLSTIAMLDRGFANMQVNMQRRGTMGLLGGIAGQGTDYLRQFGDVGANLGNIFLGLAPHLPGLGGDYLSTLEGITGGLSGGIGFMNQHHLGGLLSAGMTAEAGWRIGTPVVGLAGRALGGLGGLAGKIPGLGRVGMTAAELADLEALTGVGGIEAGGTGLAGLLGGAGAALGALTGPEVALAALGAFGFDKALTYKSGTEKRIAGLQTQIGQSGFSSAFTPLAHAIVTAQGMVPQYRTLQERIAHGQTAVGPRGLQRYDATTEWQAAATGFTQTTADLVNAGPQLVSALKKAGLKGVSMADAFQIAQNALLDTSHAFGKDGKLNQTALTMLMNYGAAIKPMTQSAGGFNAAIAAQQVMGSPAMKALSGVNQSLDSMTQIMTGGPAGMAALFGMLGGTPVTHTRGGLKIAAGPAYKAMAQALGSFTTASGAGAWNTFAGPQGLVAAEQQNLDQLRTYMTLGALPLQGRSGAQGIAGFQLEQLLPLARKSPAALAMLMQQGAQMGIGGYYQGGPGNLKQNYQAEEKALANMAGSAAQINKGMNNAVIAASNLPKTASQFSQGVAADIASQRMASAATDIAKLKTVWGHAGSAGTLNDLLGQFRGAGYSGAALRSAVQASLQQGGISGGMLKKIMIQVDANTGPAQAKINGIHGKSITISATPTGLSGVQAAINAVHGKTVTITINTINRIITQAIGALGTPGGVAPMTLAGGPAGMRITSHQTGYKVPGYGGGDIIPALLEPGELVVPKHQVAGGLVDHLRGSIPGFAAGGLAGAYTPLGFASMMTEAFNGPQVRESLRGLIDGLIAAGLPRGGAWLQAQNPRTPQDSGKTGGGGTGTPPIGGGILVHPQSPHGHRAGSQFAVEILKGITDGLKHAKPEAAAAAKAMVAKIGQEIAYAKQTSAAMTGGLNFGGLDTTQGPVQTQMQSYAASLKTFSADIKSMSKGGLNKDLLRQMIAAGPVQGDALAQSIGQGPGGIRAVNSLYASIQGLSKGIGAQAAGAIYGGTLAPNLRSGTFVNNNVSVSVNLSGKGGDLSLSNAQINQLVAILQKKLLQQAKRNNKTGVKLPGKGS